MHISTLEKVSIEHLTEAFNSAFSDYLIPLQLTPQNMADKLKTEAIDLSLSAGFFDGDVLLAFILHGYDYPNHGPMVYNAGTGVHPGYRGSGLTSKLYQHLIPFLKEKGIYRHLLEVIEGNDVAYSIYKKTGFATVRNLDCFRGTLASAPVQNIMIEEIKEPDFNRLQMLHSIAPSWQNTLAAVGRNLQQHRLWGVKMDGEWIAYLAMAPQAGRLKLLAVAPRYRRQGIGSALLHFAAAQTANGPLTITNVDAGDAAVKAFMQHHGLPSFLQLQEMKMNLPK
ncbi:MAG: GNAT family N-acetyltransferase [Chitinophagaceae bacterium]